MVRWMTTISPTRFKLSGFTLIEMLIVVVIVALMIGLALPNFSEVFSVNENKIIQRKIVTAIHFAESEALVRGDIVRINKLGDWNHGLLIKNGEQQQRVAFKIRKGQLHWRSSQGRAGLEISPDGFLHGANGSFWFCRDDRAVWALRVNRAARVRVVEEKELREFGCG